MSRKTYILGDMVCVNVPLTNERVWYRRPDGAYPNRHEPLEWLEELGVFYRLSERGKALQDFAGYDGYRYGGMDEFRIIPGIFSFSWVYGDLRKGPDSHLYRDPDLVRGPIMGQYWFNVAQKSEIVRFILEWL